MRKIKSTALLGAFVAVASVGVISHESHGATLTTVVNNIPKEMLPNSSVTLPAPVVNPGVSYPSNSQVQITLTLNGATFLNAQTYTIENTPCSTTGNGLSSITFANTSSNTTACSLTANTSYTIVGGGSSVAFIVSVPQTSNSIVLSYSSNVNSNTGNDASSPVTLAQVMPQLSIGPISDTTAVISASSLSLFTNGNNWASNSVVLSNSAFGNSTWSNTINTSYTMSFVFTGIPGSVQSPSNINGSATVSTVLYPTQVITTSSTYYPTSPFVSASSDTITFYFFNNYSSPIQIGTISLSSITGATASTTYVYPFTPQNFITFSYSGVQIYVPDALAHSGSNVITDGYITISMPSSASIASISVLNNPSASCPAPSLSNGLLTSTSTTGVYYIDLSQLAQSCTGISSVAWQSGVPLVINISGTNVTPNNITADAYATFNGMLKRIPVNVVGTENGMSAFSY